jgi:HSP20 family protein
MTLKSLLPFSSNRTVSPRPAEHDAFQGFRQDMNRVFDEFVRGFGMPSLVAMPSRIAETMLTPRIDVSETDSEIRIAAELPGIDEKDIEVTLADDVLTIRATKKIERDNDESDFHVIERTEGTFYRSIALPFAADAQQVDANFKDGVLLVSIPKPKEARDKERRVHVKGASGAETILDRAAAGDKPSSEAAAGTAASNQAAE